MFTDCCHVRLKDTKTTKQAVMIGFDLIQCYKPPLWQQQLSSPQPRPPNRMDLASYLTIRTLLFFESLIGLADKLIKGDPRSWKSWTLYYIFTADWKACKPAPVLTTSGLQSKYLHTHTQHNQPGRFAISAFSLISLHIWPSAGWNKSSVQVRDWCWRIIQPVAGLRQGYSIRAGEVRIYPVRCFGDPEARHQSPAVDWPTCLEPLKNSLQTPGLDTAQQSPQQLLLTAGTKTKDHSSFYTF